MRILMDAQMLHQHGRVACIVCGSEFTLGRWIFTLDSEDDSYHDAVLGFLCDDCVELDVPHLRKRLRTHTARLRHQAALLDEAREDLLVDGLRGLSAEELGVYHAWRAAQAEEARIFQACELADLQDVPF
jgi:hypothetical protein